MLPLLYDKYWKLDVGRSFWHRWRQIILKRTPFPILPTYQLYPFSFDNDCRCFCGRCLIISWIIFNTHRVSNNINQMVSSAVGLDGKCVASCTAIVVFVLFCFVYTDLEAAKSKTLSRLCQVQTLSSQSSPRLYLVSWRSQHIMMCKMFYVEKTSGIDL